MKPRLDPRAAAVLVSVAAVSMILGGCVIRRTHPVPMPTVVHQPAPPMVVAQPQPVVVTQPAPVIVTQPSPQVSSGVISYAYQRVRYPLSVSYARTLNIYVNGHGLDPTVAIYNAGGGRMAFNDDGGSGLDSQLQLTLAPGNYVVEVAGYASSTGPFTLTVQ